MFISAPRLKNGCREMRRFVLEAANIILQRFVLSIVEHRQSLNCCQFLIPIILIDVRATLETLDFLRQEMCNPSFLPACRGTVLGTCFVSKFATFSSVFNLFSEMGPILFNC